MPFYVLGGVPCVLAPRVQERFAALRGITVAGGPFDTYEAASAFLHHYLPAQRQHVETMLGVTLPRERYTVSAGRDSIAAIFAALALPDPR